MCWKSTYVRQEYRTSTCHASLAHGGWRHIPNSVIRDQDDPWSHTTNELDKAAKYNSRRRTGYGSKIALEYFRDSETRAKTLTRYSGTTRQRTLTKGASQFRQQSTLYSSERSVMPLRPDAQQPGIMVTNKPFPCFLA